MASAAQIQKWQDRIALQQALMGTGAGVNVNRATNRLTAAGAPQAGGNYQSALMRMALRGGVGGKKAKFYEQALAIKGVNDWEQSATAGGEDDIARAYQTMLENLGGNLGASADAGSPAVLDTIRRYVEGRASDTRRFGTAIKGQAADKRNAILLGQIAPTLDETGTLVESLRMLNQEQAALRRAQYQNLALSGAGTVLPMVL